MAIRNIKDEATQNPLVTAIVERMKLIYQKQLKCGTFQQGTEFYLDWPLTGLLFVATYWIERSCIFPTKLFSVVSVVISDCFNVTYASRHCIIHLLLHTSFWNSYDIINITSEITVDSFYIALFSVPEQLTALTQIAVNTHAWAVDTQTNCAFILVRTRT